MNPGGIAPMLLLLWPPAPPRGMLARLAGRTSSRSEKLSEDPPSLLPIALFFVLKGFLMMETMVELRSLSLSFVALSLDALSLLSLDALSLLSLSGLPRLDLRIHLDSSPTALILSHRDC